MPHLRARHAFEKPRHGERHRVRRRDTRCSNTDEAAAARAQRLHIITRNVEMRFDPPRVLDQRLAVRGGPQTARMPLEEGQADVFLKFLQPFRQRRLRRVERRCRLAEVARAREAQQYLQMPQTQAVSPVHCATL